MEKISSCCENAIWSILLKYQEIDVQIQTFTDQNWNILRTCFLNDTNCRLVHYKYWKSGHYTSILVQLWAILCQWSKKFMILDIESEHWVTLLTLNGMGSEKSTRYGGWIPPPSLFPLFEGQLKPNLVVWKYVTNSIQDH